MAYHRKDPVDFQKLITRSEAARNTLAEARVELKHKLNVVGRMKDNLTSKPAMMLGGSVVGGYLLKKIFFRDQKKYASPRAQQKISTLKKERGFLMGLFAIVLAVAKPAAKLYATKLLKDYLGKRYDVRMLEGLRKS